MAELTRAPESLYWYWIAERHAIYLRRAAGQPKPWTTDPILRDYKFTNPFRENDRGTVWLRENFLEPHRIPSVEWNCVGPMTSDYVWNALGLLAFNIGWYRMFNWTGTGKILGWKTDWDIENVTEHLNIELRNGRQVFTGAHIVYSTPGLSKIDCIVGVGAELFKRRGEIARVARRTRSLQLTYDVLRLIDCIGGFMAYEIVTDMRHTQLLEDAIDIMTWANPGPGAKRGLQRLGLPHTPDKKAIESMRFLLGRDIEARQMDGAPLDFPPLEMRDIEHSLCEFDKYCRVKFGEGEPRSKYPGAE